jgi:RNA polymerase sigma-70 factor (ECF subfamily)
VKEELPFGTKPSAPSRALPRFRGESSVATWIYRIATNIAYDRLRSSSSQRACEVPIDAEAPVKDESSGIEQQLVRREMNDCVDRFIDRLPANYRAVVILSEQEGLTNQEIAAALRLTVDTVKIRLHRARTRLRKELGDGCNFYRDERNELACEPKPNRVPAPSTAAYRFNVAMILSATCRAVAFRSSSGTSSTAKTSVYFL